MKKFLLILFLGMTTIVAKSQNRDTAIYAVTEKIPEFIGGPDAYSQYIKNNLHYPLKAWQSGIQGRVIINFVVEKDGSLTNPKILRSIAQDLDSVALSLIRNMPKWSPGFNNGVPVRASFTLPILFRITPQATDTSTSKKFFLVERQPEFPGGMEALANFIRKNLHAGEDQGRLKVTFVVDRDGSLVDVKIIQSLSKTADAEAIRVIGIMPKWKPGMQNDHPVRVQYTMPIPFPFN